MTTLDEIDEALVEFDVWPLEGDRFVWVDPDEHDNTDSYISFTASDLVDLTEAQ